MRWVFYFNNRKKDHETITPQKDRGTLAVQRDNVPNRYHMMHREPLSRFLCWSRFSLTVPAAYVTILCHCLLSKTTLCAYVQAGLHHLDARFASNVRRLSLKADELMDGKPDELTTQLLHKSIFCSCGSRMDIDLIWLLRYQCLRN